MMKKTNIGKCLLGLLLLPAVVACIQEDYPAANPNDCSKCREVELVISSHQLTSRAVTKADYSQRTDLSLIKTLDIVTMDAEGEVLNTYRVDDATTPVIEEGVTGLLTETLPVEGGAEDEDAIVYRLSAEDADGVAQVAVVANYIDASGELASLPEVSTLSELQQLKQGAMAADNEVCSMYGELNEITPGDANEIWLNRTLAMVTLQLKIQTEGENSLKKGIIIKPTQIDLVNVPTACALGADNVPAAAGDIQSEGQTFTVVSNGLSNIDATYAQRAPDVEPDQAHYGMDAYTLFLFENKQGTGSEPTNDDKQPMNGYCSYIVVTADYEYHPELVGESGSIVRGTVKYKFCLGKDATTDFNVERNTHYKLTLTLAGWGGLEQNGSIQDGTINVNFSNEEAYWRVEQDLTEFGGGVVNDEVMVPVGGSHVTINVVGNAFDHIGNNAHLNYEITGSSNVIWAKTNAGQWIVNPSTAKLPDLLVGSDGNYTLHLYVMPWSYNEWQPLMEKYSSVQDWIDSSDSYRVLSFSFTHVNAEQTHFDIYQYAPLPVLVNDDGSQIPESDFADATLFYSRFDILDGKAMRWGPEYYDNVDLRPTTAGGQLITDPDQLEITDPDGSGARAYNPAYGFHNQVAFFVTDKEGGPYIQFNDGLPERMMDYCTFTSANAEDPDGGETGSMFVSMVQNTCHMHHYALASKEEWEKIVQYGVQSDTWPIAPVPYWTSSFSEDGTENYVFNPYTGTAEPRPRSEEHVGRMVYHVNNKAEFGGTTGF